MFQVGNSQKAVDRLNDLYGSEWKEWLPETLLNAINVGLGGIDEVGFDRLLAIRNLVNHGFFWHDVDIFEATVNALNWADVDNRLGIKPSPGQIVYAVREATELVGEREFGDDVLQYIAMIFIDRGYPWVPDRFGISGIQPHLDMYFAKPEWKTAVEAKWRSMMDGEWYDLEETPVDVVLAKLIAIKKFSDGGGSGRPRDKDKALARLIVD